MTTINLDGVVGWDIDAKEFAEQLDSISGDVTFELNSGGGFVTDGISILNKIRSYDRGETISNISYAASMMTQIALACDKVNVYDNAIFMIHNVQGITVGDHRDMREQADLQERMTAMLANLYVKKTGLTLVEVQSLMNDDTYLFGSEIVNMNFADSIIDTDKDKDKESAVILSKAKMTNVKKAMEEEGLTLSDMEKNFKLCQGSCNMGGSNTAVPSDNEKVANSNQKGAFMTEAQISEMQEQNKVLLANRTTLNARNETLKLDLDTANAKVTALEADMEANISEAKVEMQADFDKQLSEATSSSKETVETRVKEAFLTNVATESTILAMLGADSDKASSEIAIAAKPSTNATHQGEQGESKKGSGILAYAKANEGRIK